MAYTSLHALACAQVSKKRYIYTIDDDCFVAKDPSGESINALQQHIRNLLTPSTPRFFNTLYDPFAEGADFVRGYPFSWRQGAPTAVSHGEHLFQCAPMQAVPIQGGQACAYMPHLLEVGSFHSSTHGVHVLSRTSALALALCMAISSN